MALFVHVCMLFCNHACANTVCVCVGMNMLVNRDVSNSKSCVLSSCCASLHTYTYLYTYKCVYTYFSQDKETEREREKEKEREKKQTRVTDKKNGKNSLSFFLSYIHMSAHTHIDTHSTSMPKVLCTFQTLFPLF